MLGCFMFVIYLLILIYVLVVFFTALSLIEFIKHNRIISDLKFV